MNPFRQEAVTLLSRHVDLSSDEVSSMLTHPPKPEMGDYAFPCFSLAKALKQAPPKIAADLVDKVSRDLDLLESATVAGPYVNFTVDRVRFAQKILLEALEMGDRVGDSKEGEGRVVAIDYSSPNIAKPFHVGHLRSTIIGSAIYRIHEKLGYRPVGINHLGDWGTQFGKQIIGLKKWGQPEDIDDLGKLNELYVKYHQEEPEHPELTDEAREWFRRQEEGDEEALELWRKIRDTSLDYLKRIYERLNVRFDAYTGESFFNDKMEAAVQRCEEKGLTSISDGALIVDLTAQGIETPALLKKRDGATLYMTRDLAAAFYRKETYDFHRLLYVVGAAQSLHLEQLFKLLDLLGAEWSKDCVHVKFGLVKGMSTRKGNVVYLEELLDEARDRALAYMQSNVDKRGDVEDEAAVAESIGKAAIIFSDLSKSRIRDYEFAWDRAISFEGDTGPYLINAHARIAGILRKCGIELDANADLSCLREQEAHNLVTMVANYNSVLTDAAEQCEPSILASYLLELARALHAGYNTLRVKGEPEDVAKARLLLFTVVKKVLASGLDVLGIDALERM